MRISAPVHAVYSVHRVPVLLLLIAGAAAACGAQDRPAAALPTARPIEGAAILYQELADAGLEVERGGSFRLSNGASGQRWLVGSEALFVLETDRGHDVPPSELAELAGPEALTWGNSKVLVAYAGSRGGIRLVLGALLGDPSGVEQVGQDEPFPPAVLAALNKAAEQFERDAAELQVVRFEEREWPDGCLGLGAELPATSCPPGPLPGWLIQIRVGSDTVQVRTDDIGNLIYVEPGEE